MKEKTNILGILFEPITKKELNKRIKNAIAEKNVISIFTPNTEILFKSKKDQNLARILNTAEILIPDGIGVILASKMLGSPLPERITGIDTANELLKYAAERGLKVFLLGAKEGIAEQAKLKLQEQIDNLDICGVHHGYFQKFGASNQEIIDKINKAKPDILFVCFGCPTQEKWIYDNRACLPTVRILVGLGGSLDVWAGKAKRAPKFFQERSLEWLWRIIKEPSRAEFILHLPIFMVYIILQKLKKLKNGDPKAQI